MFLMFDKFLYLHFRHICLLKSVALFQREMKWLRTLQLFTHSLGSQLSVFDFKKMLLFQRRKQGRYFAFTFNDGFNFQLYYLRIMRKLSKLSLITPVAENFRLTKKYILEMTNSALCMIFQIFISVQGLFMVVGLCLFENL